MRRPVFLIARGIALLGVVLWTGLAGASFLPSAVNGNIGIGTTAPAVKLDVAGGMHVSGDATVGGGMTVSGVATLNSFQFSGGSTLVNALTTSIGAGSTDSQIPTAAAVFALSAGSTIVHDSGSNYSSMYATATDATDGALSFAINGSRTMVIDHNGNVGIGTSVPNKLLSVGTNLFTVDNTGTVRAPIGVFSNTTGSALYLGSGSTGVSLVPTASNSLQMIPNAGGTGFGLLMLGGSTSSFPAIKLNGSDLQIIRADNVTNSNLLVTGKVGIGTTSPATTLDVAGNMQVSGSTTIGGLMTVSGGMTVSSGTTVGSFQFTSGSTVVNAIVTSTDAIGAASTDSQIPTAKAVYNIAGSSTIIHDSSNNYSGMYATATGPTDGALSFAINGSRTMVIDHNGNVGIGTTTPHQLLEIGGPFPKAAVIRLQGATNDPNWYTDMYSSYANPPVFSISMSGIGTSTMMSITKGVSTVFNTGNVGVGTTAPVVKLDVVGGMKVSGDTTLGGNMIITGPSTFGGLMTVSGGMTVSQDATFTGNVKAAGYYAGATAGASATTGGLTFSNGLYTSGTISASSTILQDATAPAAAMYVIGGGTTNALNFTIGGNSSVVVDQNGNIGIGTTSPAKLLHVNGDVNIASGKAFYINGTSVLNGTGLGSGVTGSSLTSLGQLTGLSVSGASPSIVFNEGTNSGQTILLNLNNQGGGYLSAVNSSVAIAFANRNVGGVWSSDIFRNIVFSNTSGSVTTGFQFLTHNNQSETGVVVPVMTIYGSRVGIGTISPAVSLDINGGGMKVSGDATVGGLMTVSGGMTVSSGTTVGSFQFTSGTTVVNALTTSIGAGSTDSQIPTAAAVQAAVNGISSSQWTTAGSNIYRASGNVGINSASPGYTLDVAGTMKVSGDATVGGLMTVTGSMTISGSSTVANNFRTTGQMAVGTYALSDGPTVAVDWNNGNRQYVTLGGDRAVTFANPVAGASYSLILTQDGTGSRMITSWPAISWAGGSAPTLTTTASKTDIVSCLYANSIYYCDTSQDF